MKHWKTAIRIAVACYVIWVLATHGLDPFFPGLAIFAAGLVLLFPVLLKSGMQRQLAAALRIESLAGEGWPEHGREVIETWTAELEALGFRRGPEQVWHVETKNSAVTYLRSLQHHEQRCLALLMVFRMPNKKVTGPYCFMETFWGTDGNWEPVPVAPPIPDPNQEKPSAQLHGYLYATHNRKPDLAYNILKHPHLLGLRMVEAGTAELYARHLEQRQEIGAVLGLEPDAGDLLARHNAYYARLWPDFLEIVRRQNPWLMFAKAVARGKKHPEWMGDLRLSSARHSTNVNK